MNSCYGFVIRTFNRVFSTGSNNRRPDLLYRLPSSTVLSPRSTSRNVWKPRVLCDMGLPLGDHTVHISVSDGGDGSV